MINSHKLRRRDGYLNKLIGFQDTEPVKVVTGIRRCGKSSLLKLMVRHLKDTGISPEQIVEMNFESFDFRGMNADDIYRYVKQRAVPGKRMYLFFDELQRIKAWEDAVNAFRVDLDCDIYVTGSNAYPSFLGVFHVSLRAMRGDQNAAALLSRSSSIFTVLRFVKHKAPSAGFASRRTTGTANAMHCARSSTPICASAECRASPTSV